MAVAFCVLRTRSHSVELKMKKTKTFFLSAEIINQSLYDEKKREEERKKYERANHKNKTNHLNSILNVIVSGYDNQI